ncbi:MAG: TetR/AcrR family transcriptional regulator [Solirubrobacterales bacterium]|nr:TetR/AcrR family transcriptional regulator [Solirubrobacterales bacterium]
MATTGSPTSNQTAVVGGARERILEAAYELFSRRGVRGVGIDAIIARAGVARMTLYRHFSSKEELALACLARREQRWTRQWLQVEIEARATAPGERLLAVFDVFDEWFQTPEFEGCTFIRILLEATDSADSIGRAGREYLAGIRNMLADLARQAGLADAEDFAFKWHILMKGSIVAAGEGDLASARRAQQIAKVLLNHELQAA